jgi:hypothetical protein
LTDCVSAPPYDDHPACGAQPLLVSGVEKEIAGDLAGARADYQAILDLGATDAATEAALRLQSLGGSSEYGQEQYAGIRDDLLHSAQVVEPADAGLSMLYRCNAWVVEAEHGDFELAVATLDSLRLHTADPVNRFNAELALAEAYLVGAPSGLSSLHGTALAERQQAAANRLVALTVRGPVGEAQPMEALRPGKLTLGPAYPNPFNPVTTIPFTLTAETVVDLAVFNLLGQRVATLAQGRLAAGAHVARLDGAMLASGLYLVRLSCDQESRIQKVMLLK